MKRAIFTLGWDAPAAAPDDPMELAPAPGRPQGLRAWQALAKKLDTDLSASWLVYRAPARPPAEVLGAFCGTAAGASEHELLRAVRRLQREASRARVLTDFSEVARRCERLRRAGKRIVFTNGVFDLLHVGHLRLLEGARSCGDALVVGVNSDESARRLKGRRRPVVPQFERAELVAAIRGVDFCAIFDQPDPRELLRFVRPDVLAKGSEYTLSGVVGRRMVEEWGGRVVLIAHRGGWSSTAIIERLRRRRA
ncbi:MAG: adenylyltransferase/cytidyltransferase family protein [Spirochaetia bacterium]|jgi:D-beta-D-heptose 7-phosphate kinase/D-beta-D-heptose 1-phosphate adenosyltransferase